MKTFKLRAFLLFSVLIAGFSGSAAAAGRQEAFVQEVLTGDTVRLRGGKILKYAGIEAPPLQHMVPLVRVYGQNSKAFNEKLVLNKKILIEWGKRIRDNRNNLLGYVYLEDGTTLVNLEMLKTGNAKPRIVAHNLNFSDIFQKAAWEAQKNRLGLWKEEPKNPYTKEAYVGEKNTKIYYLPNSPELDRIPQANLVTFRSRVEASAAGYRACQTCKETVTYGDSASLY